MAVDATPRGDIAKCPRVGADYLEDITVRKSLRHVLDPDDRKGAK